MNIHMKLGLLGDIHSNLSALRAVHAALVNRGATEFLSVGDVIGYGAAPNECVEFLQDIGAHVILGNHDAACAGLISDAGFNQIARIALEWTREALVDEHHEWLKSLPWQIQLDGVQAVHGTLNEPEEFHYAIDMETARASVALQSQPICVVGHSHIPLAVLMHREALGRLAISPDSQLDLTDITKLFLNLGSVGQPRDEDPRAACALFDSANRTVELLRVEYDVNREVARIRSAGLPTVLGERLRLGL